METQNEGSGDIFEDTNRPARDLAGENWFKFEKVGDKVGGTIKDVFESPEHDGFPAQRCFTLLQENGKYINVGIKKTSYLLSRTDMLQVGDRLGIKFDRELPPKVKGFHPAKSLVVFTQLIGERTGIKAKDVQTPLIQDSEEIDEIQKKAEEGRPEGDMPF